MNEELITIAGKDRASHWRENKDGQIEFFRRVPGGLEVGQIEGGQMIWRRDRRFYPPEDAVRL